MRESNYGNLPRLYQIFHGEVASLQTYGAFIKIPGCRKQGLVHISQLCNARVEDPADMLVRGERVYCKVIGMEGGGEKISLSMKVVSQTTGQDLDPNNVQSSQDERKRRQWNNRGSRRIELGAELNTTCRRCGGHGHLAMDCYAAKGDNRYGLIPDFEVLSADEQKSDRKHRKKEKKKKKQKTRRSSSDSDDSDSDDDRRKKSTKVFSKGHSGRSEKGRQKQSDSGSGSDLEGFRHKEDRRHDHRGSKIQERSRRDSSDSEGDLYSASQGHRKPAGNSLDYPSSASRAWQQSASSGRADEGREGERWKNKSVEKHISRRDSGETNRRSEPYGAMTKKRNISNSDSDEAKKRDRSDSYRNEIKKRDMNDSYRNEAKNRDSSDSYRNEAKKRDTSDSYRNEGKKREMNDSYKNEGKKKEMNYSYRNEAKKKNESDSDSENERLRVKRSKLDRDKSEPGRYKEDYDSFETSGRKAASSTTTRDSDRYRRDKY